MSDESLISESETANLRKIFDTKIESDEDLIALSKLCNEEPIDEKSV